MDILKLKQFWLARILRSIVISSGSPYRFCNWTKCLSMRQDLLSSNRTYTCSTAWTYSTTRSFVWFQLVQQFIIRCDLFLKLVVFKTCGFIFRLSRKRWWRHASHSSGTSNNSTIRWASASKLISILLSLAICWKVCCHICWKHEIIRRPKLNYRWRGFPNSCVSFLIRRWLMPGRASCQQKLAPKTMDR